MYQVKEVFQEYKDFVLKNVIEEATSKEYTAENLFAGNRPSNTVVKDILTNLRKDLKTQETKEFEHERYLSYQKLVRIEGEYYILREKKDLIPFAIYIKENKVDIEIITNWCITLIDILSAALKAGQDWQVLKMESLWVDKEGKLFIIEPAITQSIIYYRDELRFDFEALCLESPEKLSSDNTSWTEKSIVYNIGVIAYYLITGNQVYTAYDNNELTLKVLHAPKIEPRLLNSKLSSKYSDLILEVLDKHPDQRPTLEKFKSELNKLAKEDALVASKDEQQATEEFKDDMIREAEKKQDLKVFLHGNWKGLLIGVAVLILILNFIYFYIR